MNPIPEEYGPLRGVFDPDPPPTPWRYEIRTVRPVGMLTLGQAEILGAKDWYLIRDEVEIGTLVRCSATEAIQITAEGKSCLCGKGALCPLNDSISLVRLVKVRVEPREERS